VRNRIVRSLRSILLDNVGPVDVAKDGLGSDEIEEVIAAGPRINPEKLQRDLAAVSKTNTTYFIICVIMVVVLFIVSIGVVLTNLNNPDIIKVVLAAFGVSCAGLITMMIKLWREKSNIELLIILAINMDLDTLKTVVAVLVRRLN
jgi:hypothetical protein